MIDSGQTGHFLYYLTPWADGGTLRDRLKREPQLGLEDAQRVVEEVGDALAYAHRAGIIHRDVKPENILFRSDHALLADFGIARAVADTGRAVLTESGLALGTPTYMSPEQATADGSLDERSDQYALACILFEMLAGDPPFSGRSSQAIIARHLIERPPSLSVVRPDLPPNVVAAINRALEKAPAARFPTIGHFLAALRGSTTGASLDVQRSRRRRWFAWGVASAAVVVAAAVWIGRPAELSPNRVAVFPLVTRGLAKADSNAGVGIAYLLEAALERANPLQLIDVAGNLTAQQLRNPEILDDRSARRIARGRGAAYSLRGVIQGHQDSTTVILRLYGVAGDSLILQSSASGLTSTTPLHHLGIDALKAFLPALIDPARHVDFAPLRDRRASAIALWMQGERYYRRSQFDSASALYDRALEDDSTLAMAAIKGAQAASWLHQRARGVVLATRALALERELPRKYVLLANGLRAYLLGSADSAVTYLRAAHTLEPNWVEPVAALGETFEHLLPSDRPLQSFARENFESAIATDSEFLSPYYHLAEAAVREGRLDEADRLIATLRRAKSEPRLVRQLQLMRDCVEKPLAMVWPVNGPASASGVFEAAKSLSAGAVQPECAESAFRAILRGQFSTAGERWGAFLGLQGMLVARGAEREAKGLIDSVVASGKGVARSLYVLNTIAGASMKADAEELDRFARAQYGEHYERVKSVESLWVLLGWQAERKDPERLQGIADTLSARALQTGDPKARMFADAARAHVLLARGDTASAIKKLQTLANAGPNADLAWQFGDALPVERLLLAQLLLASGRHRDCMLEASVFDHPMPILFLPFVRASLELRYRAALAIGDARASNLLRLRLNRLGRGGHVPVEDSQRR